VDRVASRKGQVWNKPTTRDQSQVTGHPLPQ
jgi:hypothetical protein